ncbi:CD63 antigen-like [Copidosoma floridanum]|uniref:CD63 antigen-like n=1 Tax=Copidosoma floridanum TaxID=29053 RepID=UPI000C6F96F2|nr:CD63 antigen-like [Copidosoma floridanum]
MTFEKDRRARRAMASNDLEIGMRCVKYLLCAVNFLFVLTGVAIIAMGSTIFTMYEDFSYFLDARYFSPAMLLVAVGVAIFVVAFFGCCGALRESTCMVLVFAVSLFMILFLEFSAALASYAYRDVIINVIDAKIDQTMHMYESNVEAKRAIDCLQTQACIHIPMKDFVNVQLLALLL